MWMKVGPDAGVGANQDSFISVGLRRKRCLVGVAEKARIGLSRILETQLDLLPVRL
jgi:hypothetical protein